MFYMLLSELLAGGFFFLLTQPVVMCYLAIHLLVFTLVYFAQGQIYTNNKVIYMSYSTERERDRNPKIKQY